MKKALVIILGLSMWGMAAMAQHDGPPPGAGHHGGPPPLGVMAQINLGGAGLLESYYSNDWYGTMQGRMGRGRAAYGAADSPYAPQDGYEDSSFEPIINLTFQKGLSENSYLVMRPEVVLSYGSGTHLEVDTTPLRFDMQYMKFPAPDMMFAIGAFYENTAIDIKDSGTVDATGFGVRGDVIKQFNEHWGAVLRAEYTFGNSDLEVDAGPAGTLAHEQGDDRLYTQLELIGQYKQGRSWYLAPMAGVCYQNNSLEETADSFGEVSSGVVGDTETYGSVWGKLRAARQERPGIWMPEGYVGFEYMYANDLDGLLDESSFALYGVGVSRLFEGGKRLDIRVKDHLGLDGIRHNTSVTGAFTYAF